MKNCSLDLTASFAKTDKSQKTKCDHLIAAIKSITNDNYNNGYINNKEADSKLLYLSDKVETLLPIVDEISTNDNYAHEFNAYYNFFKDDCGYGVVDAFFKSLKKICIQNSNFYKHFESNFQSTVLTDIKNNYLEELPSLSESQKKNSKILTRYKSDTDETSAIYLTIANRIKNSSPTSSFDFIPSNKSANPSKFTYYKKDALNKLNERLKKYGLNIDDVIIELFEESSEDVNGYYVSNDFMDYCKEIVVASENINGFADFFLNTILEDNGDIVNGDGGGAFESRHLSNLDEIANKLNIKPYYQILSSQDQELPLFLSEEQNDQQVPTYYEGNITPDDNTIFVFGSNPEGRHGAGAAKVAVDQFGAKLGQGEGLQGNSYALPTKDLRIKENNGLRSISPKQITENIKKMYDVARKNPNKQFKVAYTNKLDETTLNGYTGKEMIQMFKNAGPIPSNVIFSKNWTDNWNESKSAPKSEEEQIEEIKKLNKKFHIVIDDYKMITKKFHEFLKSTGGVVAIRVPLLWNNADEIRKNHIIGNPFSYGQTKDQQNGETASKFYKWLVNGEYMDEVTDILNKSKSDNAKVISASEIRNAMLDVIYDMDENASILYDKVLKTKSHAQVIGHLLRNKDSIKGYTPRTLFFSGGAQGADTFWGEAASKYGYTTIHLRHNDDFMKKGFVEAFPNNRGYEEAVNAVMKANETLKHENIDQWIDKFLARDYMQVKKSNMVVAIADSVEKVSKHQGEDSHIEAKGTPWAVQMAIDAGKPVYVYDLKKKIWTSNIDGKWNFSGVDIPRLDSRTALIGTTVSNNDVKKVAYDVMSKNFGKKSINGYANDNPNTDNGAQASEQVLNSSNTILSSSEVADWNKDKRFQDSKDPNLKDGFKYPRILAASESTDPAFHVQWIKDFFDGKVTHKHYQAVSNEEFDKLSPNRRYIVPTTGQKKKITVVTKDDIDGLYLITKQDGLPTLELLKMCKEKGIPMKIHFSITTLGGTNLEKGVMPSDELLKRIGEYIKMGYLNPKDVTLRIDPIVPDVTDFGTGAEGEKNTIHNIFKFAQRNGIDKIKFSVLDYYPDSMTVDGKREGKLKKEFSDALGSLGVKSPDTYFEDRYKGEDGLLKKDANQAIIDSIALKMVELKNLYSTDTYSPELLSCAEVISPTTTDINGNTIPLGNAISKAGCLSVAAVNEMLGLNMDENDKYYQGGQRSHCSCFKGKVAALDRNDTCLSHCLYCFAEHQSDPALELYNKDGSLKHNQWTIANVDEYFGDYDEQYNQSGSVTIKKGISNSEFTVFDKNFINDFTINSEVEIYTDLASDLSDLKENDLVRVNDGNKVVTAYVKEISTLDNGIKISFFPKESIVLPADYNSLIDNTDEQITSVSNKTNADLQLDLKAKIGTALYQTYVNTTKGLINQVISANLKGKKNKDELHIALNKLGGFNGVVNLLKNSLQAQLNQPNAKDVFIKTAMSDLVKYKRYTKDNIENGRAEAEKIANTRLKGYNDILNNIDVISFDAITEFATDNNLILITDDKGNTSTSSKERTDDERVQDKEMEEKESWQFDAANAHAFKSISQELKEFLEKFPMLTQDKNLVLDEMYMPVYISSNKAYNALQYILTDAFTFQEMMDILSEYTKTHPEFKRVITYFSKEENKNNGMQQKFFQLFNKQKNNFEVLYTDDKKDKKVNAKDENGNNKKISYLDKEKKTQERYIMQQTHSIRLNELDGDVTQQTTYAEAQNNISNQVKLSKTPFNNEEYRKTSESKKAAGNVLKSLRNLKSSFDQQGTMSNKQYVKWLESQTDNLEVMYQAICGLGINVSRKDFDNCISFATNTAYPIEEVRHELYELFSKTGNLLGLFEKQQSNKSKNSLQKLCTLVHKVTTEEDRTMTVRADNKDYALYKNPSYLSNGIKHIKDKDKERREEWVQNEFKQYDWFYTDGNYDDIADRLQKYVNNFDKELDDAEKEGILRTISRLRKRDKSLTENGVNNTISNLAHKDFLSKRNASKSELDDAVFKIGRWKNKIIQELCENKESIDNLKHTIVLTFNKEGYAKMSDSEYLSCVLDNYFRYRSNDALKNYANFVLPILADANSFEFLRLKKRDGIKDCIDELFNVFLQEKERINLINMRESFRMKAYDEFNKIKSLGSNLTKADIPNYVKWLENGQKPDFIRNVIEFDDNGKISNSQVLKSFQLTDIPYYSLPIANFDDNDKISFTDNGLIDIANIKTKQGQGHKFQFLSFLNMYMNKNEINDLINSKDDDERVKERVKNIIRQEIRNDTNKLIKQIREYGYVLSKNETSNYDFYSDEGVALIEEFAAQHMYAHASIIEFTVTDLAQYKNAVDFQKRYKQVYASTARMDTSAPYGRETAVNLILKDRKLRDRLVEELRAIIAESSFDKETKALLEDAFKEINASDAQSFRSFSSLRAIMSMSGKWEEDVHGVIFDKLINGQKLTAKEMETALQTLKPFVFTQKAVPTKIDGKNMKVGFQIKNSEFILLYAYTQLNNLPQKDCQVILALNKFMEDNGIDVVHFESAIKVGLQGAIDFNDDTFTVNVNTNKIKAALKGKYNKDEKDSKEKYDEEFSNLYKAAEAEEIKRVYNTALSYLYKVTNISKPADNESFEQSRDRLLKTANPEVVHTMPYSEYGIITSTPEHYSGKKQRIGTQLLRLVTVNNTANDYKLGNKQMNGKEVYEKLNELLNAKMLIHFGNLRKKILNQQELENFLLDTMRGNSKFTSAVINAIKSKDSNGNLNMLGDPVIYGQIDSLLNSLIRTEINEMELEGGTCIQVSPVFAHDLHIKYAYEIKDGKKTNHRIQYWECRLPVAFKSLYEKVMDENGCLSIDKLYSLVDEGKITKLTADKLLRVIGIRIPTEAKHSIQHLKCVGFIEGNNGSSIMLPAEITQVAGSDYDVDKMYVYRYSFKIDDEGYPQYVMYNLDEPIDRWNEAQINNCIIDTIWAILEHPKSAADEISPSNYERSKKAAYISAIMSNEDYYKIAVKDYIESNNIEEVDAVEKLDVYKYLRKLDSDYLNDNILSQSTNRLSIYNQLRFFVANTLGKDLLGIMAVNNTAQALMQHTTARIKDEYSINIDGRNFVSLSDQEIKYSKDHWVQATKTIEEWITAAADNTKDPVLAYLGINRETVNVAVAMARLGYEPLTIGIFLNHPEIRKIFKELEGQFISPQILATKILERFTTKYNTSGYPDIKNSEFKYFRLDGNTIKFNGTNEDLSLSTEAIILGTEDSQKVLFALYKMFVVGQDLNDIANVSRADSTSGSVGASMAEDISKVQKINYVAKRLEKDNMSVTNCQGIIRQLSIPYGISMKRLKKQILDILNKSVSGYVQGQTTFALQSLPHFFKGILPVFSDFFLECCHRLSLVSDLGYLNEDLIKRMSFEYIKYSLSKLPFFGDEFTKNGFMSINDKNKSCKDNMWGWIKLAMIDYPELKNNTLLSSLTLNSDGVVSLPNAGTLENGFKEKITNSWAELLNSSYPEVRNLGMNLLRYSFYRNCFRFAPDGFGHLAPDFRHFIDGYEDAIQRSCNNNENINVFMSQFIVNNYDVLPYHYSNSPLRDGQSKYFSKREVEDKTVISLVDARIGSGPSAQCDNKNNEFTVYSSVPAKTFLLPEVESNFVSSKSYDLLLSELNDLAAETENDSSIIDKYIDKVLTVLNKTWC